MTRASDGERLSALRLDLELQVARNATGVCFIDGDDVRFLLSLIDECQEVLRPIAAFFPGLDNEALTRIILHHVENEPVCGDVETDIDELRSTLAARALLSKLAARGGES